MKSLEKVWNFIMVLKVLEFWVFGLENLPYGLEICNHTLSVAAITFSTCPLWVNLLKKGHFLQNSLFFSTKYFHFSIEKSLEKVLNFSISKAWEPW